MANPLPKHFDLKTAKARFWGVERRTEDHKEGEAAFIGRRKPQFRGR
jgi:hypothetical protein